jgi:hypothetical protein
MRMAVDPKLTNSRNPYIIQIYRYKISGKNNWTTAMPSAIIAARIKRPLKGESDIIQYLGRLRIRE